MAISEEERHALYNRLQAVLGDHEAATLMEHLPPVGWADVATKRDLEMLERSLGERIEALGTQLRTEMQSLQHRFEGTLARETSALHQEIAAVRGEVSQQLRTFVAANVGIMATLVSLTFAAVRLG